ADRLTAVEDGLEERGEAAAAELAALEVEAATAVADRLLSRAPAATPGYLMLNACSFARRAAVELDGVAAAVPIGGPVKASQLDGDKARLVVEIPALGFAWV